MSFIVGNGRGHILDLEGQSLGKIHLLGLTPKLLYTF